MKSCPVCKRAILDAAMILEGKDDAGVPFLAAACVPCSRWIYGLPQARARRVIVAALNQVVRFPDRHPHLVVADPIHAQVLTRLAADPSPAIAQGVVDLVLGVEGNTTGNTASTSSAAPLEAVLEAN